MKRNEPGSYAMPSATERRYARTGRRIRSLVTATGTALVLFASAVLAEGECPTSVADCELYRRCVESRQRLRDSSDAVAHCLRVHDRARREKVTKEWDTFMRSDEAGRTRMVREVYEKQCARGIRNMLCP